MVSAILLPHGAAERNDPAAAEALLPLQGGMRTTERVVIDGWNINKGTALMVAAVKGHTGVARLLVEREGGMSNSGGWTALMWAAEKGRTDCARLLLEREKHMRSNRGETALSIAKRLNHPSLVSLLSE